MLQIIAVSITCQIIRAANNLLDCLCVSNGQSFWLKIQWFRVRLSALPDFLRSTGSQTGPIQPREDNLGAA
jgi:hypothetical protein